MILFTVGFSIVFIIFCAASTYLGQVLLQNSYELRIIASFIIIILVSLLSNSLFNVYNLSIFIGFFLFAWITLNLIYDFISKLIYTGSIRFFFKNIGMFMAHLGLALFVIGAAVVEHNKIEKEVIMNLNEKLDVGGYSFEFVDINENMGPNYSSVIGHFRVYINNEFVTDMYPEKRLYNSSEMPMTEAGIDPGFKRDLYITLGTMIDQDKWSVRIYHKPLIRFIWIGALMMALGAILSVLMKRRNTKVVI